MQFIFHAVSASYNTHDVLQLGAVELIYFQHVVFVWSAMNLLRTVVCRSCHHSYTACTSSSCLCNFAGVTLPFFAQMKKLMRNEAVCIPRSVGSAKRRPTTTAESARRIRADNQQDVSRTRSESLNLTSDTESTATA
jgi:hypothetical protein